MQFVILKFSRLKGKSRTESLADNFFLDANKALLYNAYKMIYTKRTPMSKLTILKFSKLIQSYSEGG